MSHPIRPGPARPVPRAETGWRKAAASDANSGCVEIAFLADGRVGVRDSKDPGSSRLPSQPTSGPASSTGPRPASSTPLPEGEHALCRDDAAQSQGDIFIIEVNSTSHAPEKGLR